MRKLQNSPRRAATALSAFAVPLTAIALALTTMSSTAAAIAPVRDLGVVSPSTRVSAVVWLKGSNDSGYEAAVSALHDQSSPSYHRWMQDTDIAAYGPSAQDLTAARDSLAALGLSVDKVFDGGTMVRVSGSAAQLEAAFGSAIHQVQSATGETLFKAASTPQYKGAHAELVGGVSGLSGSRTAPFVARQMDLSTGQAVPGVVPQAGTDPLGAFTSNCFGKVQTITEMGVGAVGTQYGNVTVNATGPTYLSTADAINRQYCGYTAGQLVAHYGVNEAHALGLKGKGQTIVIVDAYGSPTALEDLNTFSKTMGLPTMTDKNFHVVYPDGAPTTTNLDWSTETTLDIEWAHAFAPEAKIVLVITPNQDDAELAYAVDYAAEHHLGNVISNSWGEPEAGADKSTAQMFNQAFKRAAARGIAVNVATGDEGDNHVGSPLGAPSIPADSPYATAIGGTSIGVPSDAGPVESAWGLAVTSLGRVIQPTTPDIGGTRQGSGGGESVFWRKPAWQRKLPGNGRQTPDISAIADPQTGAITVQTDPDTGIPTWYVVGGTSLATPIFSAIWALADEAAGESLGQAAPVVAELPPFAIRDILPIKASKQVTGSVSLRNGPPTNYTALQMIERQPTQPSGFATMLVLVGGLRLGWNDIGFGLDSSLIATPGWDNATGYGVPNGLLFIESAQVFGRHH